MDTNSKLQDNLNDVQKSFNGMCDNLNDLITCQICLERFQSAGERIPCKLKCPHIMCKKCADIWLTKVIRCTVIMQIFFTSVKENFGGNLNFIGARSSTVPNMQNTLRPERYQPN